MNKQERREYDNTRWRRRRKILVAALGGQCMRCGATEDLEFDHIDPEIKSFTISSSLLVPWEQLLAELGKCQLLCHPCHAVKTAENNEHSGGKNRIDEHGTEAFHDRTGCRCTACTNAKRQARIRRGERKPNLQSDNIYGGRGRYGKITVHGSGTRGIKDCKCTLCKHR